MKKKLTIIHLSDLHIGYMNCEHKFATIVHNIIQRESPKKTVIVITGDIVEYGSREQHVRTAVSFLHTLKKAGFKVLLCPGNHDYGSGFINNRNVARQFKEIFLSSYSGFPLVDVIGDYVFIGIDSNAGELHWYDRFFADGEIGGTQLEKLRQLLHDPKYEHKMKIVYLHHHPTELFPFHQLKDTDLFQKIVQGVVDVLLYGHNHFGHNTSGTWGIPVMLDGGSSTGKRMFLRKVFHRMIRLPELTVVKKDYLSS
ncbi:metallophosphoesterase family protein [Candidatus Margulisiibacteriota bacterium]